MNKQDDDAALATQGIERDRLLLFHSLVALRKLDTEYAKRIKNTR